MNSSLLISLSLVTVMSPLATRLEPDHRPLVEDLRAAEGRVRLVTVLSPT